MIKTPYKKYSKALCRPTFHCACSKSEIVYSSKRIWYHSHLIFRHTVNQSPLKLIIRNTNNNRTEFRQKFLNKTNCSTQDKILVSIPRPPMRTIHQLSHREQPNINSRKCSRI